MVRPTTKKLARGRTKAPKILLHSGGESGHHSPFVAHFLKQERGCAESVPVLKCGHASYDPSAAILRSDVEGWTKPVLAANVHLEILNPH
ncbi:MAG: hypothetical protein EBS68_05885 [Rhodobacteraceae bacterium]|nr:hypothetical protein [Paracoccaceae bacterium]